MMRSWENRPDCAVTDEPLYAHYLAHTGLEHPGREEVMEAQENDWRAVATALVGPVPQGRTIWYQKHMTHHLLPHIERDWLRQLTHVFLIRDPRDVLVSYIKSRPEVSVEDIGLLQQLELFRWVSRASGTSPPVLDASEFLKAPEAQLRQLCARLEVPFMSQMLRWRAGPRASDGVWAPYWYDAVLRSTGFEPFRVREHPVPERLQPIIDATLPAYLELLEHRIASA
jgi:Sulfotransferase domain